MSWKIWAILIFMFAEILMIPIAHALLQSDIDRLANDLKVKVKSLGNTRNSAVSHKLRVTLTNAGSTDIPNTGWTLYFHSFFLLYPDTFPDPNSVDLDLEKVRISMIQGDLYSMKPINGFKVMRPNASRDFDLTVAVWSVSRTDYMPRWYLTGDSNATEPRIILSMDDDDLKFVEPFNDVRQWKRYDFDRYNPYTAQQRLRRIQVDDAGKLEKAVIPTPLSVTYGSGSSMIITNTWRIYNNTPAANRVAEYIAKNLNLPFTTTDTAAKTILLRISPTISNVTEAYNLKVKPSQGIVELEGKDEAGLFYAVQSLLSILDGSTKTNTSNTLPDITIKDAPRFPVRGMHIDVARNFHGVADIKRLLDAMAMYKLNTLHLHLTDDEGWRLEIPSLPELTKVGGFRCHDLTKDKCIIPQYGSGPFMNSSHGSGYYTVQDYKDILRYADERNIEVVPEFDMPGHAHAAIAAMEKMFRDFKAAGNESAGSYYRLEDPDDTSKYLSLQNWRDDAVNPCLESTYRFIGQLIDDVINMHADVQPMKTFHFGGDEVPGGAWKNSPVCKKFLKDNPSYDISKGLKKYFAERVSTLTYERGVAMRGWEDGFMDGSGNPFAFADMKNPDMSANAWDNIWEWGASQRAHTLANAGYKVVMSQATHLYFDHPYEPDPEERGLYWAPRFTDTYKTFTFMPDALYDNIDARRSGEPLTKVDVCGNDMSRCAPLNKPENVIGMQGHLWSETVRTSEQLDYMIFPRFLALAERAWHKAPFESADPANRTDLMRQDWKEFANTVGYKELSRLDKLGIKYRVPPPGARVMNGKIEVSTSYPGLIIEISFDAGATWSAVKPIDLAMFPKESTVLLRTRSTDGKRYSRVVQLFEEEPVPWSDQSVIDYIGDNVDAYVSVIDNLNKTADNYNQMELQLQNTGNEDIKAGTWKIYFYSVNGIKQEILDCGLRARHVTGSLHYVTPNDIHFPGIKAGQTLKCVFHNKWWSVARTDQFPNWYVGSLGMKPKLIKNTADETLSFVRAFDTNRKWKRSVEDLYDPLTTEERYAKFERSGGYVGHIDEMLLPTPFDVTTNRSKYVHVIKERNWTVHNLLEFSFAAGLISKELDIPLQNTRSPRKYITFVRAPTEYDVNESYHVTIDPQVPAITITANDKAGAFYGAQTAIALVLHNNRLLSGITIKDKPRFGYRGLLLDVARNFKTKEQIYKMLDAMSMYRMNKLQLHLTDDQGWRIEIPGIPELAQIGGKRCHSDYKDTCIPPQIGSGPDSQGSGSGFYTAQDYKDILQYAADRNIEVIPEIDIPGYSAAAIQAMSQREAVIEKQKMHEADKVGKSYMLTDSEQKNNVMNPCLNSTYEFIRDVISAVKNMHSSIQPLRMIHICGEGVTDSSWDMSEMCNTAYPNKTTKSLHKEFLQRVADITSSLDLDIGVWGNAVYDGKPYPITDFKSKNVYVYPWDNRWEDGHAKQVYEFTDAGYKVILPFSTHLYLNTPPEPDPEERGLYWASRATDVTKVFGFMPDNVFANADVTVMGQPIKFSDVCNNSVCPSTTKPENIIGMQGSLFTTTIRTEEQLHEVAFPRLLALAERAWHKASWEDDVNVTSHNAERQRDFERFLSLLGVRELSKLEQQGIHYRVPPPGAKMEGNLLKVNTRYPNHPVEYSIDDGQTWTTIHGAEQRLAAGTRKIKLRSRSLGLGRYSRVVSLTAVVPGHGFLLP